MDFILVPTRYGSAVIRISSIREIHDLQYYDDDDKCTIYLSGNSDEKTREETVSTATASELYEMIKNTESL